MKTKTTITTVIISDNEIDNEVIPWDSIVARLTTKFSLVQICQKTGCGEKVLSSLKNGVTAEPKFSYGVQILALHGKEFPHGHRILFGEKDEQY